MSTSLNLPLDIPWKLIEVSRDMMDTEFCNKLFPFEFRSSLAIYAYEPDLEDLPEELCNERITYFKVSCSITGYQASQDEVLEAVETFPSVPIEDLEEAVGEYLACYGVLLNVAVFPHGNDDRTVDNYPHIVDFDPKTRDLYQTTTESGEILSASTSKATIGKSLTSTNSSETGISGETSYTSPESPYGQFSGTMGLTHDWGSTSQDTSSVTTDASREKRETESTVTQLSQMYNLLTSYHAGTNRATFLMLPRPHILQPTDHRTFVQGLRIIEGMQDFIVVVSRPDDMEKLCIEASLETSHFPEEFEIEEPEEEYETSYEDRWITGSVNAVFGGKREDFAKTYTANSGWEIDKSKGTSGHAGISELENDSNDRANNSLQGYNYQTISDTTCQIDFSIKSDTFTEAEFRRKYRFYLKSLDPVTTSGVSEIKTPFIITRRNLCTCIKSGENCVERAPILTTPDHSIPNPNAAVYEGTISLGNTLLNKTTNMISVQKDFIRNVQFTMVKNGKLPSRYPDGEVNFLGTDYFANKISKALPQDTLDKPISHIDNIPPNAIEVLGRDCKVKDLLNMSVRQLASRLKIKPLEALRVKGTVLGRKNTDNHSNNS